MTVSLILFDTALELIPKEIRDHPAVLADARRHRTSPEHLILDRSVHHFAMSRLKDHDKRGRPDIAHMALLVAVDSPAYREGRMNICVHTHGDIILRLQGTVRLPVNYNNFVSLMVQVFGAGSAPIEGKPLIRAQPGSLGELLEETKGYSLLMSSRGRSAEMKQALDRATAKDLNVLVGGYPKGPPPAELPAICNDVVSIYTRVLASWTVVSRVVYDIERYVLGS